MYHQGVGSQERFQSFMGRQEHTLGAPVTKVLECKHKSRNRPGRVLAQLFRMSRQDLSPLKLLGQKKYAKTIEVSSYYIKMFNVTHAL